MKNLSIAIRFGLIMSVCLIAYFLILGIFNLHINPIFSVFNGVIIGFGIFETINYSKYKEGKDYNYINGFKYGIVSGGIATLIFTIFFTFFATEIDPKFIYNLLGYIGGEYEVHVGLVGFSVAIMGLSSTVILTLTAMQLFKPTYNIIQKA
jgi:hypothetical protein